MAAFVARPEPGPNGWIRIHLDQLYSILRCVVIAAFVFALVYAMGLDFNTARIPNWLTVPIAIGFLPGALLDGLAPGDIFMGHLGTGVLVLVGAALMFARGWIGGGDAKFLAALGVWAGWPGVLDFLLLTAVFSGILAVITLIMRAPVGVFLAARLPLLERGFEGGNKVPLGVAIGLAGLLLLVRLDSFPLMR